MNRRSSSESLSRPNCRRPNKAILIVTKGKTKRKTDPFQALVLQVKPGRVSLGTLAVRVSAFVEGVAKDLEETNQLVIYPKFIANFTAQLRFATHKDAVQFPEFYIRLTITAKGKGASVAERDETTCGCEASTESFFFPHQTSFIECICSRNCSGCRSRWDGCCCGASWGTGRVLEWNGMETIHEDKHMMTKWICFVFTFRL